MRNSWRMEGLYVARFSETGRGEWIEPDPGHYRDVFPSRNLDSIPGRRPPPWEPPRWIDLNGWQPNPLKVEAYCALTNNKNRGIKPNAGGDPTPVGGPNPRKANHYGQIVRWDTGP